MTKLDRAKGLNQVREILFDHYPDAKAITVEINGDKIRVKPNEEYEIPVGHDFDEDEG